MYVWYLDTKPVCIQYKPYRKSDSYFLWLDDESYNKTYEYIVSLKRNNLNNIYTVLDDNELNLVYENLLKIDHKEFEKINIKS